MDGIRNLLLIDDERRFLDVMSMTLVDLGYEVKTAAGPEEALKLAADGGFDVAFIDQHLGTFRGLDLMKEMSAMDPELYFVIVTGSGTASLASASFREGASDFISKPVFISDIVKSIEHVGRKRRLDRERRHLLKSLERQVSEKTEELNSVYFSVLSTLAQAMEKKDIGTYGHCRRVGHCSRLIALSLGLSEEERQSLKAAAMLHDIGKIGISDFILGKKGNLDSWEVDVVRRHPQKGVEILKPIKQLGPLLPAILHHHESWDGSGYPHGLKGEDIPLYARIITVADTYDAIISSRPYRSASSHEDAVAELMNCAGSQFDPRVVQAFVEAQRNFDGISDISAALDGR
jgi:response regulator RpfG family c-di-GMP phosphodiesterase